MCDWEGVGLPEQKPASCLHSRSYLCKGTQTCKMDPEVEYLEDGGHPNSQVPTRDMTTPVVV